MSASKFLSGLLVYLGAICTAYASPISVETILPETAVDVEGDQNVFSTPFDYRNGQVFTIHVEPPSGNGIAELNLRTVVRHGVRQPNGDWRWEEKVIEPATIRDPWHTQGSIALDKEGYVHVAYNMHNMPWQYSVSTRPMDISSFEFRGQEVSLAEKQIVKFQNKTPFPTEGSGAIPGNQVTYPAFFKDDLGELYVTYRFALKPAQIWEKRAFAGAIAKYDTNTKLWRQLGGEFIVKSPDVKFEQPSRTYMIYRPFAFEDGYSVYLTSLAFDRFNGIHGFWNWRDGGAGSMTQVPSYFYLTSDSDFYKSNGFKYRTPINLRDAEQIKLSDATDQLFYAPKSVATLPDGGPVVVIHSIKNGRQIIWRRKNKSEWENAEPSPSGASEIVVDKYGKLWAFASGIKVFVKSEIDSPWQLVGEIPKNLCQPKVKYISQEQRFVIHAKTCDGQNATIFSFRR